MTNYMQTTAIIMASCALTATTALAQTKPDVCDGGYSVTDVDGNGYVSPIEMNAYAEQQSSTMDADKSGSVSRDEYVNCSMEMMGQQAKSEERTEADMQSLDADGDGTITQSEFMQAGAGTHAKVQTGDQEAIDRAGRLILQIEAVPQIDIPTLSLEEYAARSGMLFVLLDTDRDAGLSREEFMAKAPPMIDISEVLNREFDSADADRSGDLTTTELIAANNKRAERAMKAAEQETGEKADPEQGPPVVYYTYPSTM